MSNVESKKELNKIVYKKKWDMVVEEIKLLPKMVVEVYKNKKYKTNFVSFDIVPNLTITNRIKNSAYFTAMVDNKVSTDTDKISWKVPYRLIKGKRKDNGEYWFGIDIFLSINSRLSFYIDDDIMRALENAKIDLNFVEVSFDENEFGAVEVDLG